MDKLTEEERDQRCKQREEEEEREKVRRRCESSALKLMWELHGAIVQMNRTGGKLTRLFARWPKEAEAPRLWGSSATKIIRETRDTLDAMLKRFDV